MIIIPPVCEKCGAFDMPTEVMCDKCERVQSIKDFSGIVLNFSPFGINGDSCDQDCEDCEVDESDPYEFHFCDMKCISEYISDPNNNDRFDEFEECKVTLFVDAPNVGDLFYVLGRYNQ